MAKKQVSTRLPEELVERADKITNNRSNLIANALVEYMADPDIIEDHIERQKREREELIDKKHKLEKEIERKRDSIRELEDLKTEMATFNKIKDEIPESELENVRDAVTRNKYDSDPRAPRPQQVIEHNAERISEEYSIEKEKVRTVLKVTTEA